MPSCQAISLNREQVIGPLGVFIGSADHFHLHFIAPRHVNHRDHRLDGADIAAFQGTAGDPGILIGRERGHFAIGVGRRTEEAIIATQQRLFRRDQLDPPHVHQRFGGLPFAIAAEGAVGTHRQAGAQRHDDGSAVADDRPPHQGDQAVAIDLHVAPPGVGLGAVVTLHGNPGVTFQRHVHGPPGVVDGTR
ncbi:hypothetical protein Q427_16750 [Halomonas sp. BC04]|nr:hypothetical protein Q427_16750 [Halomonas sp. BC04]